MDNPGGISDGFYGRRVNTTGGGSGSSTIDGHEIQDEGSGLTQRANLNFVGAGVTATDDAGNDATIVTINGGAGHDPLTVTDSSEIDFTLTDQDLTASLIAGSIDESKLDTSVNDSLDLADSATQPADIADFETTTELNARDTANRDRANHTGTQAASTISDFDTEVSNNTDVSANTSARHDTVSVTDSDTVDLTLTGQDIEADVKQDADYNWTGQHTHTDLRIPSSAAPSVTADGDIATDTDISGLSHGIIRHYAGEELFTLSMPVAQLSALIDGYVPSYNATTDEFELVAQNTGLGDTITTYINNFYIDSSEGVSSTHGALSGAVDGVNDTFTVSRGEYVSGKLQVAVTGIGQGQGSDLTWQELVPGSGTFQFNTAPPSGYRITATYIDQETTSSAITQEKTTITISSNTAGTSAERNVLGNAASGDITYTLPVPGDIDSIGIRIKKIDTSGNSVIIAPNNTETIDGDSTFELTTPDEDICVISDGTNYYLLSH